MTPEDQMAQLLSVQEPDTSYLSNDSNALKDKLLTLSQKNNLVDDFKEVLDDVKNQITSQLDEDRADMEGWLEDSEAAMTIAKMLTDGEQKDFPFENSSQVMAPLLFEAAQEFSARYKVDVTARKKIAAFEIIGPDPDDAKEKRAERTETYFNKSLKKGAWISETDIEMMALPIVGTTYKKIIFEERKKQICPLYVAADKIIFSQKQSFESAPQVVHELEGISRNTLIGNLHAGIWEFDESDLNDDQQEFDGYECHFFFDFDEDGYAEPYIATYIETLESIVRIRAGFLEEGIHTEGGKITEIERKEYFSQKKLLPDPEGGPMGIGFGIILRHSYESINSSLRMLIDAGVLQNVAGNSGLIANASSPRMGADGRMGEGPIEIEIGKLTKINVSSGQSLAQNIVQLPAQGPSVVLFQLMQYLDDSARRMTTVSYNIESSPGEAAALYLARLAQSMKSYNAMMCRVYEGLTKEFKIMARCMYEYAAVLEADYRVVIDDDQASMEADFNPADCDLTPTANPAHGSDAERLAKASMMLEMLQMPIGQSMNQREVGLNYLEASGVENPDKYMPEPPEGPSPMEQQQNQYLAMEAEFRNREMEVKEKRLAMDEMKMQLEALHAAAKFEQDMKTSQSVIDVNIAKALETMSKVAVQKIGMFQAILDAGEKNLENDVDNITPQPTIGNTYANDDQRGLGNVAQPTGNQDILGSGGIPSQGG